MLGFSAAAIGRTQNTPDILAVTPRGRYLVIECTTGGLASTVSVLLARTGLVRQRLQSSGHSAEVLPVLVTSKHREDVKADIPAAEQNGVVVVTREDLLTLVDRTFVLRSADVLFDEIVAVLKSRTEETAEGI
jgi:Holliday junction resolvase